MNIDQYFHHIDRHVHEAYDLANAARALGYDPEDIVAVPLAKNMAERVVGLISVVAPQIKDCGVDVRIRSLEEQYGVQDWRVALTIALEVAQQNSCSFKINAGDGSWDSHWDRLCHEWRCFFTSRRIYQAVA